MATVTTRAQQAKIGAAARKVGGYSMLIDLAAKKRAGGQAATIAKDKKTGAWSVITSADKKKRVPYKFETVGRGDKPSK